jgi:hypothetical protein
MTSDDPYQSPSFETPKKAAIPTWLSQRVAVVAILATTASAGAIAGAIIGHEMGRAADQFDLTYFGTPPRVRIVEETLVGFGSGGVFGVLFGMISFLVYRLLQRLRRRAD